MSLRILLVDDHEVNDLILKLENILLLPVETLGPEVAAVEGVNHPCGDAKLAGRSLNDSFEYILDPLLFGHLFYVHRFSLVRGG